MSQLFQRQVSMLNEILSCHPEKVLVLKKHSLFMSLNYSIDKGDVSRSHYLCKLQVVPFFTFRIE